MSIPQNQERIVLPKLYAYLFADLLRFLSGSRGCFRVGSKMAERFYAHFRWIFPIFSPFDTDLYFWNVCTQSSFVNLDRQVQSVVGTFFFMYGSYWFSVTGYSWSGGGRRVIRVDVSIDQGQTWQVAELIDPQNIALDRQWAWTRWQARVPVDQEGSLDVWVRAVDSSYNVQPENFNHIWNARGLMASAFHKIQITVQK